MRARSGAGASASPTRAATTAIALALALVLGAPLLAGCTRTGGAPSVRIGAPCASCGMAIRDTHFACVRGSQGHYRQYDSIECLLRDGRARAGEATYLPDYDRQRLCAADSVWVVQGSFPTPMGGGFAAFANEGSAREVGARTRGLIGRLHQFLGRTEP